MTDGPSFAELVDRAREAVLGATDHQEVPFERLLEEIQPERHLSRSPLFQVFFNMIDLPDERPALAGARVIEVPPPVHASKFDCTLYAGTAAAGISLQLVFDVDLFDRARMEELLRQYEQLLARFAADPETPVGAPSLLTGAAAALLPDPSRSLPDRLAGPGPRGGGPGGTRVAGARGGGRFQRSPELRGARPACAADRPRAARRRPGAGRPGRPRGASRRVAAGGALRSAPRRRRGVDPRPCLSGRSAGSARRAPGAADGDRAGRGGRSGAARRHGGVAAARPGLGGGARALRRVRTTDCPRSRSAPTIRRSSPSPPARPASPRAWWGATAR